MDDDPINELRSVGLTAGAAISRTAETLLRNMQERARQQQATTQQPTEEAQQRITAQGKIAENHFRAAADPKWADKATPAEQGQTWKAAQQWSNIDPDRFGTYADQLTKNVRDRYGDMLGKSIDRQGPDGRDVAADLIELSARRTDEAEEERAQSGGDRDEASREQDRTARERQDRDQENDPQQAERSDTLVQESADRTDQSRDAADTHQDRADALDGEAENLTGQAGDTRSQEYDTSARRATDDQEMQNAGVPDQARNAKMTADHGNGADPRTAARSGGRQRPRARAAGQSTTRSRTANRGR